jgi:hypothetical protein
VFKRILATLAVMVGLVAISASPAAAVSTCSSSGICFYASPTALPIAGYNYQTPALVCQPVPDNQTTYIDNNTQYRWYVWTGTNCTGTRGPIYPHSEGSMTGAFYRTIGSTWRTTLTS